MVLDEMYTFGMKVVLDELVFYPQATLDRLSRQLHPRPEPERLLSRPQSGHHSCAAQIR